MDPDNPLPQLAGTLDAILFRGLLALPDRLSPLEGGSDGMLSMVGMMFAMMFRMRRLPGN